MKIACQTITFGNERHKTDMAGIIKSVAAAGYGGMETGFFRLDVNEAGNYRKLQDEYNVKQAAIHIGGDFNDAESVKKQLENIPALIKTAQTLGCENIFLSGSPANAAAGYETICENINALGKRLKEDGLALSYHNHDWEIKNNYFGLYSLCGGTDPEYLSFVPDIGWIKRGGGEPVPVLEYLGGRVSNLHFKEFTADGKFTELGGGIVNFKEVYDFVKTRDFWIVAEQDASYIGAEQSAAKNFGYIKSLMQ